MISWWKFRHLEFYFWVCANHFMTDWMLNLCWLLLAHGIVLPALKKQFRVFSKGSVLNFPSIPGDPAYTDIKKFLEYEINFSLSQIVLKDIMILWPGNSAEYFCISLSPNKIISIIDILICWSSYFTIIRNMAQQCSMVAFESEALGFGRMINWINPDTLLIVGVELGLGK